MNPARVDAAVDLTYGALIALAIVLIVLLDTQIGTAFGLGVFVSYAVHVAWKMGRFDPDWMTSVVQESVDRTVEEQIQESVDEQLEDVQEKVETVDERLERRPREAEVEELIEEAVEDDRGSGSSD